MTYLPDAPILGRYYHKEGDVDYQYLCPECDKRNLWWRPEAGVGQCFSCSRGFGEYQMKQMFGLSSALSDLNFELIPTVLRAPLPRTQAALDSMAEWYLFEHRKFHRGDLDKVKHWYEPETDRVCFGLNNVLGGTSPYYMSRSTDPDTKGWMVQPADAEKSGLWFNPRNLNPDLPMVIVEGIGDILTPRLMNFGVAILGVSVSIEMEYVLRNNPRLYVWLDPDKAGRQAMLAIKQQLPQAIMVSYHKEPGDCTPEEARDVLRKARSKV